MVPTLTLLDVVSIRRGEEAAEAVVLPTTRAMDLLCLVAASDRPLGVDHLVATLWPRADADRGRQSLRTALAQLRRSLGPDVVLRTAGGLVLGEVATDVAEWRRVATSSAVITDDAELLALVTSTDRSCGATLVVSDSSCRAVYELRTELAELRASLLLDAAGAADRLGLHRTCLDLARRADRSVSTEATARMVMTAWAANGETGRAVEVYEGLRTRLGETFGVAPSAETQEAYARIVVAGAANGTDSIEVQDDVVRRVASLTGRMVRSTGGGVVWLHGEPGSGRSRVARAAVNRLRSLDPMAAAAVMVTPEIVRLPDEERERLLQEATASGSVLLVPLRQRPEGQVAGGEAIIEVAALDRSQFRRLLSGLLDQEPTAAMEARLWTSTGGLAGQAARTVAMLRREQARREPVLVELFPVVPRQRRPKGA